MERNLIRVQEQLSELILREQRAKTEKAELELETARIQLEATRAFVRDNRNHDTRKPS
jgi:hypothetical protein